MTALLIRADAGEQMGTGHVMRTLALAQAWQDAGGSVGYAMAAPSPGIAARLDAESVEIDAIRTTPGSDNDAHETIELARKQNADWVVVDGYQFGGNYQRFIKESGLHLLVLDDYGHADHYWADLVLNQNLHADESSYRNREPYTRLLLGIRHVLLRREFRRNIGSRRREPQLAQNVLVTLGGSDPANLTCKIIESLKSLHTEGVHTMVVLGAANRHVRDVQRLVDRDGRFACRIAVSNMAELIAAADVVILSGGSTVWECAALGAPAIVGAVALPEAHLIAGLKAHGLFEIVGAFADVPTDVLATLVDRVLGDGDSRQHMADIGRRFVDGRGCMRVLDAMQLPPM